MHFKIIHIYLVKRLLKFDSK